MVVDHSGPLHKGLGCSDEVVGLGFRKESVEDVGSGVPRNLGERSGIPVAKRIMYKTVYVYAYQSCTWQQPR